MTVTKIVGFDLRIPKHFSLHFSDFSRFYMEFTSLMFLKTKEKGNELLHLDPWTSISSHGRFLADGTVQRRFGRPFSGEVRPRRRGLGWGKGRGD